MIKHAKRIICMIIAAALMFAFCGVTAACGPEEEVTLQSISVTTGPEKTEYVEGQKFDPSGMVVKAKYSDGSEKVITDYTVEAAEALAKGTTSVMVKYKDKTATVSITVAEKIVESIAITGKPSKVTYVGGQTFNPGGMEVTAKYNDGTDKVVTDYTYSPEGALERGVSEITVTYGGKTATQDITVVAKAVTGISVKQAPSKTDYVVGQTFDKRGMKIEAEFNDGTKAEITDYTVDKTEALTTNDTVVTITYGEFTATQKITVVAKAVTELKITTQPTTTQYIAGQRFNSAGMVVTATYNDGTKAEITDYTVDKTEALTTEDTVVTVTYGGKSVEVEIMVVEKTLTGIEITMEPTKTNYVAGQSFDPSGMVVRAKYDDGSDTVLGPNDYMISPKGALELGVTEIIVTYDGKKAKQNITVVAKVVTSIAITKQPAKTEYVEGQTFDTDGMEVTATYNDGSTETVTDYTVDKTGALATSDTFVTITYGDSTAKQNITVVAKVVTSIAITKQPAKTEYVEGQTFGTEGMEVTATYNDGTSQAITGYTCAPDGALETGTVEITVSYGGKTATITISVAAKTLTAIEITKQPTNTGYIEGDFFDPAGMEVTAHYNNGVSETVADYTYDLTGSLARTNNEITVTYNGKTAVVPVVVGRDALKYIEAEEIDGGDGPHSQNNANASGGAHLAFITKDGNFVSYKNIKFDGTPKAFEIMAHGEAAFAKTPVVTVRIGSVDGEVLTEFRAAYNSTEMNAKTYYPIVSELTYNGEALNGFFDVYLQFSTEWVNIDKIRFLNEMPAMPGKLLATECAEKSSNLKAQVDNGIRNLGAVQNNNYAMFADVYFGAMPSSVTLYTAGQDSTATIRIGSMTGPVLATVNVKATGNWTTYQPQAANIDYTGKLYGHYDLYVCINSGMNLGWIEFSDQYYGAMVNSPAHAAHTAYNAATKTYATPGDNDGWFKMAYLDKPLTRGMTVEAEIDKNCGEFIVGLSKKDRVEGAANYLWVPGFDIFVPEYNVYQGMNSGDKLMSLVNSDSVEAGRVTYAHPSPETAKSNLGSNQTIKIEFVLNETVEVYVNGDRFTAEGLPAWPIAEGEEWYLSFAARNCTRCVVGFTQPAAVSDKPLYGKNVTFLGDSITYGHGVAQADRYATVLSQSVGANEINLGVSGTTYCTGYPGSGHDSRINDVAKVKDDTDYLIVKLGINDFDNAKDDFARLGDIDSTDTTTVYGALNTMYAEITRRFGGTDTNVIICTPLNSGWTKQGSVRNDYSTDKVNYQGYTLPDLCNAIKEVATKYSLPVLDLNTLCVLEVSDFSDGLHPNAAGMAKVAVCLEKYILSSLNG